VDTTVYPNYTLTTDVSVLKTVILNSVTATIEYIEARSHAYNLDPKISKAIANAESQFKFDAKNPKCCASGLYQYTDSTFQSQCIDKFKLTDSFEEKNDPHIQIECFMRMATSTGYSDWNESKHIWSKLLESS